MNSIPKMNSNNEGIWSIMKSLMRRIYGASVSNKHPMDTDLKVVFPGKNPFPPLDEWNNFTRVVLPVKRPPLK